MKFNLKKAGAAAIFAWIFTTRAAAADGVTNSAAKSGPAGTEQSTNSVTEAKPQNWNFHAQNTDIVQGYPAFPAKYTNPGLNSLPTGGEVRETVSLDVMAGARLWPGAEAHVDGQMWQGFGINNTAGLEAYPNGEAYRLGTRSPTA